MGFNGFGKSFAEAKAANAGVYLAPGDHLLSHGRMKVISPNTNGKVRDAIVVEFEVIESTVHVPGSIVSWFVDLSYQGAEGDIKSYVAGLYGVDASQITPEMANALIADNALPMPDAPAYGRQVKCHAWHKPNKRDPSKVFTKTQWISVDQPDDQAEGTAPQLGDDDIPF